MFALFNLSPLELVVLALGSLLCSGVVTGLGILLFVLTRPKDGQRND